MAELTRRSAGCGYCDTTCTSRCSCPGCTAPADPTRARRVALTVAIARLRESLMPEEMTRSVYAEDADRAEVQVELDKIADELEADRG